MPIYRYKSDNYSDGNKWNSVSNIYRFNSAATTKWQKIKKIYRYKSDNYSDGSKWKLVFQGTDVPQPTTPYSTLSVNSTTYGTVGSTTEFYSGDVLRLTRGAWTQNPTEYQLRIQKSQSAGSGYTSVVNTTYNATSTPTAGNTTNSTYIQYTVTAQDALHPSYYIKGRVDATNADGTTPLETSAILLKMGFGISGFSISSVTDRGAYFSWTITGVPDAATYIYSQQLTIRKVSDGTVVKTVNIAPGTNSASISDNVNILPNTQYYAKLVVTAYDSWFLTATPTTRTTDFNIFTTLKAAPSNTVAPVITPLNNRTPPSGYLGYLPVSTTLTANKGTWANTDVNTTYLYNWFIEDSTTGSLQSTGFIGDTQTYSTADVGDYLFVNVRATNSDGLLGTASSGSYILNQAVAVSNVTPTSATQNVSTNFSFSISHYPTSYIIDWGDGTSDSYSVSANTSTVNQTIAKTYTSTGVKTITITAQPGSKTSSTSITVSAPAPTGSGLSRSDVTITPSQPSTLSFSSSSNQVTTSWTNGSPITSVQFQASGAGVSTNYTNTSAPFITSDVSNYFSSAIYSATVTNYNNDLQINVSWNQANTQSYRITYNSSTLGQDFVNGNSSASSVSVNIPWSSVAGAFSLTSVNLYSGLNQSGTSTSLGGIAGTVTPTIKSSSRSGSTLLTYTPPAPVNTSIPTLSPTSISVGTVLTAGVGTWSNSPTSYDIRIYRGTAGVIMSETLVASGTSTSLTYTVTQADYNSGQLYFRTYVNATNSGGSSGFVAGQERGPIQVAAPVNTVAPSVTPSSGTAGVTQFSSTTGSWSNSPTSYSYQWRYLDQGSLWLPISGATSSTYTPPSNYVSLYGSSLRCYVTASNAGGSATANSNTVTVSTGGGGSAPATPTGLNNVYNGGTSYTFSWTAVSGATSYQIIPVHATDASGTGASEKTSRNFTSGSTYDSSVDGGTASTYVSFKVRATNANGSSAYSAIYTPYR